MFLKLFWYKIFVHSELKLLNFLVDSVLNFLLWLESFFTVLVQWSKSPDFWLLEGEYVLRDVRSLEYTICHLQKVSAFQLVIFIFS